MKLFFRVYAFYCVLLLASNLAEAQTVKFEESAKGSVVDANGQRHGLGLLKNDGPHFGVLYWAPKIALSLPDEYDLRALGWCAPVRDQGACGSCWAFSITKSLESALLRAGKPAINLSEQDMVSCDKHAYACDGGMMDDMDYVVKKGLPLEVDYPYTATSSRCKNPEPAVAAKGIRWGYVGQPGRQPTLSEIKQALMDHGVLSVTVAAGGSDWNNGGDMSRCNVRGVNHMVNLVGWKKVGTTEKLIGRNSWGTEWGDKGDFYAAQGCDQLASGSESVSWVEVDGAGPGPVVPHISLPARIDVHAGTEIALGRHVPEEGVTYAWFAADVQLPDTGSMIYVTPLATTVYRVKATTSSGTAESSVLVNVLAQTFE